MFSHVIQKVCARAFYYWYGWININLEKKRNQNTPQLSFSFASKQIRSQKRVFCFYCFSSDDYCKLEYSFEKGLFLQFWKKRDLARLFSGVDHSSEPFLERSYQDLSKGVINQRSISNHKEEEKVGFSDFFLVHFFRNAWVCVFSKNS